MVDGRPHYDSENSKMLLYEPLTNKLNTLLFSSKHIHQGVTSTRLAGNLYTGYQDIKDIRGLFNAYQEKTDQISIKYLIDLSRISKICAGYT